MRKFIMFTSFAVLFFSVFVFCVSSVVAEAADIKTIEVSNAQEFLEALGSDRIIEMDYTGDYNLSEWDPYLVSKGNMPKLARGVSWSEVFDGGELVLNGIKNLTIRCEGAEGVKAEIVINPRYSFVMKFENCRNIAMEGLSAGHSEGSYCEGGVFSFTDSSQIAITNTRMYGCGTEGLTLSNVSGMNVTDSGIYDCTYYIMTVTGGENITFMDCMFIDNQEFTLINVSGTKNMSFRNCYFNDNKGQMFGVEGTTISVSNSSFNRNHTDSPIQGSKNVKFADCEFN